MSEYAMTPWALRRLAAIARAEAERNAWDNFNAQQWALANIKHAEQNAERERDLRARAEVVHHLMQPGALGEMVMARSLFNVPIVAADEAIPTRVLWMPRGLHDISGAGLRGGGSFNGTVACDEAAANVVIASFAEITREGWRAFIDFSHQNAESAAWVLGFSWDQTRGILCAVNWTSAGEQAVRDQIYTSFSPTFALNWDTGRISGLVPNLAVGALTNVPAFGLAMPPILAARSAMAQLVRDTLLRNGRLESSANAIAAAIDADFTPEEIRTLTESLP